MKSKGSIVIGGVAGERLKSRRRIMIALPNGESLMANRGVPVAGGVVTKRILADGRVFVASRVESKRSSAGGRVVIAGVVLKRSKASGPCLGRGCWH